MIIAKTFTFDAAHRLTNLPSDHKCHRLHGHTYEVEIVIGGPVEEHTGMVIDYAEIAAAWSDIHDALDHRFLNDIVGLEIPTTEVLAVWILRRLGRDLRVCSRHSGGSMVKRLRVKESSSTWCEVTWADV